MSKQTEKASELTVCGWNAVMALLQADLDRVKRLFFERRVAKTLKPYVQAMAARRKVYRAVTEEELTRIAGTVHHGGTAAVISKPRPKRTSSDAILHWAEEHCPILVLEAVSNPHNLGAIVRNAAFFNVKHLVWEARRHQTRFTTAAYRIAEGGMEHVQCWETASLTEFCAGLDRRFSVIGTDVQRGTPLQKETPHRERREPVALVLGNEESGLSKQLRGTCHRLVTIPGSGKVESLNVSAATAVLMYHFFGEFGG